MKVLNLYAGIGGNRKLWENVEVTAVEINEDIAGEYRNNFPNDTVIVGDAREYLVRHYKEFDFIWSSPPCPTHSTLNFSMELKRYPSMVLYQEIIFLKSWFKGKWCVENVIPYYDPIIKPSVELSRHLFWSNFYIEKKKFKSGSDITLATKEELARDLDFPIPRCQNARLLLRNCVKPEIASYIFNCAFKEKQTKLPHQRTSQSEGCHTH